MSATRPPKLNSNGNRAMSGKMDLFKKRASAIQFDWVAVDPIELLAALTCALNEGAALMFSPASGGKGVCLKVFQGDSKAIEYATLPEELTSLLEQVADHYASGTEDIRESIRLGVKMRG